VRWRPARTRSIWSCSTARCCGLKVAGGVRTLAEAIAYLDCADARLGTVDATRFRTGTSALFTELDRVLAAAG